MAPYKGSIQRNLLSLANYGDMARVQTVGAQHAVPAAQSHRILRASIATVGRNKKDGQDPALKPRVGRSAQRNKVVVLLAILAAGFFGISTAETEAGEATAVAEAGAGRGHALGSSGPATISGAGNVRRRSRAGCDFAEPLFHFRSGGGNGGGRRSRAGSSRRPGSVEG